MSFEGPFQYKLFYDSMMLQGIRHTLVPPAWAVCTELVLAPADLPPATCALSSIIPTLPWWWFFPAIRLPCVQGLPEAVKYEGGHLLQWSSPTPILLGYILLHNQMLCVCYPQRAFVSVNEHQRWWLSAQTAGSWFAFVFFFKILIFIFHCGSDFCISNRIIQIISI